MKTSPNELHTTSAPELAEKALDQELNGAGASSAAPAQVNDLSGMVKKKKKAPEANGVATNGTNGTLHVDTPEKTGTKRKADDDAMEVTTPVEKKVKLADEEGAAA